MKVTKAWTAFTANNPSHYQGYVALKKASLPRDVKPSYFVREAIKQSALGQWEVLSLTSGKICLFCVAFKDQADFEACLKAWGGKLNNSQAPNALGCFEATLP